jgi:hypothetical protein
MMVEDKREGTNDGFVLRDIYRDSMGPHQIPDSLGSIAVTLFGNGPIKPCQKVPLKRYTRSN